MIGRPIIRLDSVPSTQDVVFRLADRGAAEGLTVLARHQSAGRGRAGRAWIAPPGSALTFSVLLRPDIPPASLMPFSLLVADAIAETILAMHGVQSTIKWPNDVLVGGRKLSGVLLQARGGVAVLGVGLNVRTPAADLPDGATSLVVESGAGSAPDPDLLLGPLLHAIAGRYRSVRSGDTGEAMDRVHRRLHLRGEQVVLRDGDRERRGRILGVRGDGALLLEEDGHPRAIVSGELVRGPRPDGHACH